ncbi:hypothetical protein C1I98_17330 [Spongiactinospora gelatinilytica]|uniref:Uncharacterized protein n=2 Tax=Spongiactinospora gelatinilytica TaxID=2666298 RepID=A0A2W2GWU5_9ACTN|nr:hypothetical protein C1I98_17330 [Spongiactinospora gelatinilytica]
MSVILTTVFPDGRRDSGGMGGGGISGGTTMAVYHGKGEGTPLSILCRTKPIVSRVRIVTTDRHPERLLEPVATLPGPGEKVFVAVLPPGIDFVNAYALNDAGDTLGQHAPRRPGPGRE